MNKKELDLLEKVFEAEINGALGSGAGILQSRSKTAQKLVDDGLLEKVTIRLGGQFPVVCEGYRLTLAGNMTYCMSDRCADGVVA